jgi:hypothetical protein
MTLPSVGCFTGKIPMFGSKPGGAWRTERAGSLSLCLRSIRPPSVWPSELSNSDLFEADEG